MGGRDIIPDPWLAYDFGTTGVTTADIASVGVIFLTTRHSANGPMQLQSSNDGVTWTDIATVTCNECEIANATVSSGGGGGGGAQAKGDPHLVNVLGQRFDLVQPGVHVLARVPKKSIESDALLHISGQVKQIGNTCMEMYFQEVNITGRWVEQGGRGPESFHALKGSWAQNWRKYGEVRVKVTRGTTMTGTKYLNVLTRNLDKTGFDVGGLLGEDDHTSAATPSLDCKKRVVSL